MTISHDMWEVLHALAQNASHQVTLPGHWTPGKQAAVWAKYQHEVEAIVRGEKLTAVEIVAEKTIVPGTTENPFIWWNPAGGWPLPHFHLADHIYPATPELWNKFSSQVLAKVGANLQKASAKVTFEQFMGATQNLAQF